MSDFGNIVLVPFPFTDLTASKVRPALVVSRRGGGPDVIVCFISSKHAPRLGSAARIDPSPQNGLKVPSVVRFDRIATLDRSIVLGELGRIDRTWLRKNRPTFFRVFGFWRFDGGGS